MGKDPSPLQELQDPRVRSLEREDALEKEMATHSTILGESLKIPWTEELGGPQSMGLQKSWTQLSN